MAAPSYSSASSAQASQASGTSMNVAVGAGTDALILVHVVSRSSSESFSTPTLTGVTFSLIATPLAGRGQHTDRIYGAYGTWSAGNVVLGFSVSTVHAAIADVWTGVDATTPYTWVKYRNTNGDSGAGSGGTDTAAPDITFSNTAVEEQMVVFASTRNRPPNTNPGDVDYTRLQAITTGTGGNEQSLTSEARTLSPTGSDTWACTLDTVMDWSTSALLLSPVAAASSVRPPQRRSFVPRSRPAARGIYS